MKIVNNGVKYRKKPTGFLGDYVGDHNVIIPVSLLDSYTEVVFEGKRYKVPTDYDKWLRLFYGDYMKLPPENERMSLHSYEAYYCEGE